MTSTIYEHTTYHRTADRRSDYRADHGAGNRAGGTARSGGESRGTGAFDGILNWLGRIGERSAGARQAAEFQRLNALSDAQLARIDLKRSDLIERCFGWRAFY